MWRKMAVALGVAGSIVFGASLPAGAATPSATPAAAVTGQAVSSPASIPCSVSPGHYCAKIIFASVSGGIRVHQTKSTGYTTGAGRAREYFRYSCNAGTCYVVPSAIFVYHSRDVQLNVTRTFSGSGLFLPCGNELGVDYINPAVKAPGPGPVLFHVVCSSGGTGSVTLSA